MPHKILTRVQCTASTATICKAGCREQFPLSLVTHTTSVQIYRVSYSLLIGC